MNEAAFASIADAENSRASLSFLNGGFLGELPLIVGVAGEENLEIVFDWGVVSQTTLNSQIATEVTLNSIGQFAFGLSDADSSIFFVQEGGETYLFSHLYDCLLYTSPSPRDS